MRRSCPHMPIMKYIGISVSSQKTKKRKRSSETKTPIMAVSITSSADEEALHVFVDRLPGAENRDGREERGQEDEKQADAVDADVVVNEPGRSSRAFRASGIAAFADFEAAKQEQRNQKFGDRSREGDAANPVVVVRAQHEQRRNAEQRQERDDRQKMRLCTHASASPGRATARM